LTLTSALANDGLSLIVSTIGTLGIGLSMM
jgi:hypothetical protein